MNFLFKIAAYAIAVLAATYILPGVEVDGYVTVLIVATVLIVLNATLKPMLKVLTLPITMLTLGLFALIVNAVIVLIADWLISGFMIDGFITAILFGLVLTIIVSVFESFDKAPKPGVPH